jgi:OTU domain-containing protein 6
MHNDEELREAVTDALTETNKNDTTGVTTGSNVDSNETLDEILVRHRKEIRQLNAETTALKKTATKGEKKKKKEVLAQIAQMESEMNKKHEEELKNHKPQPGDPANVEAEDQEEVSGLVEVVLG